MTSISINARFSPQNKPFTDVLGLEICSPSSKRGVPAVRIRKREGRFELVAAGFLSLTGDLPSVTGETTQPSWILPKPFQAPHTAIAVSSELATLRHTLGLMEAPEDNPATVNRTASRTLAPDLPPLTARIPEFQAQWAVKLFPEGRAPTVCSLQVSAAAAINTFITSSRFESLSGTAVVLFVFPRHTSLVAFHDFRLVLYREHNTGYEHIRDAVSSSMSLDPALADSVLDDSLVDPTSMMDPILRPLYRQFEISYDYLLRRRNCQTQNFLIGGLPSGLRYWTAIFNRTMNMTLMPFLPFEGIGLAPRATVLTEDLAAAAPYLMTALGAAQAAVEDV